MPDGPGSGLRATPAAPSPSARRGPATPSTASARCAGIADHAAGAEPVLAHLELRLHHRQQVAVGCVQAVSAGSTSRSEMKDRSATVSSTGPPISSGVERAHVGAVEHRDPRVGAQCPGQLPVADVDGDDLRAPRRAAARR